MIDNKKILIFITACFLSILFIFPLLIYGLNHYEEYGYNIYTLEIFSLYNFNPFIFFFDLLGPGTKFPIGHGLFYFFPSSFLITNKILFYSLTIFIGISLQSFFVYRSLLFLKLKTNSILIFLYCLSITNITFLFDFDYLDQFISFSMLPFLFYHSIKFISNKKKIDFYIIILATSYLTLNGHLAYSFIIYSFVILLYVFNNSFFFLKKKYFYLGLVFFLFITLEYFFFLSNQAIDYASVERVTTHSFKFRDFFSGFFYFLYFLNDHLINLNFVKNNYQSNFTVFFPFSGLLIYFSFIEAVLQIIKKQSKIFFNINYIFLIFYFLSSIEFSKKIEIISGPYYLRDICVFLSIFLFAAFISRIKISIIKKLIIYSVSLFAVLFYFQNILLMKENKTVSPLNHNKNFKKTELFIEMNKLKNNNPAKVYLSPAIYQFFSHHGKFKNSEFKFFRNANIFHSSDLIKFNLYPFNYLFKTSSKNELVKPEQKMYSEIKSKYDEISDENFLSLFSIKYVLILGSEIDRINIKNFNVVFKINQKEDKGNEILLLERIKISSIILDNQGVENLRKINCNKFEQVYCLLQEKENFNLSDNVQILRNGLNKYLIKNKSNDEVNYILPFLYDKNWTSDGRLISSLKKTLMFVKLKPNENLTITYYDKTRTIMRLISFLFFLILIFKIIFDSIKNNRSVTRR